jgi:hypothetical protein
MCEGEFLCFTSNSVSTHQYKIEINRCDSLSHIFLRCHINRVLASYVQSSNVRAGALLLHSVHAPANRSSRNQGQEIQI